MLVKGEFSAVFSMKNMREPLNTAIIIKHTKSKRRSFKLSDKIAPTIFILAECFDKRNKRSTRRKRKMRRKPNDVNFVMSIHRMIKYGTTATMSIIFKETFKNFFRSGQARIRATNSKRKYEFKVNSNIKTGSSK